MLDLSQARGGLGKGHSIVVLGKQERFNATKEEKWAMDYWWLLILLLDPIDLSGFGRPYLDMSGADESSK